MASITKLSVRGVRAFSPDDAEQVVEFYFPITILVGQNGCGKTTIIESLKYAITGSLPPGNKSGQAFVHDPRSINKDVVKAQVKLRFTSRNGQAMVVARSMELTQKKKTISFKQLDGALRMMDEDGKRISLSHKCTELDKQIPTLMGMSKAILDNVLFCHQEDASWPLQEGAVLKKRFDDIFDSTRYTKALEVFRKTEKDLLDQVKTIKADLQGLASHRHAAEGFRKELAEQQELEEELAEEKEELKRGLAQVEEELAKYNEIIAKIDEAKDEISELTMAVSRSKLSINKQREMVEDDLTEEHSLKELKTMLKDHGVEVSKQQELESDLNGQASSIKQEIKHLEVKKAAIMEEMGGFKEKKKQHEKRIKERVEKMERTAQAYGLDLRVTQTQLTNVSFMNQSVLGEMSQCSGDTNVMELSAADIRGFFKALNAKERDLKSKLQETKRANQESLDAFQKSLSTLQGKLEALKNEYKKIKEQREEVKTKLNEFRNDYTQKIDSKLVEELRTRADEMRQKCDEFGRNPRKGELNLENKRCNDEIESIKRRLNEEDAILASLREVAETQNTIDILQEQCGKDLVSLKESIQDESSTFLRFNIESPKDLPSDGDADGDKLIERVGKIVEAVHSQQSTVKLELESLQDDVKNKESVVSEKTGALTGIVQSRMSLKAKLDHLGGAGGCLEKFRKILGSLRGLYRESCPDLDERSPEQVLAFIRKCLEEVELQTPVSAKSAKSVLNKLLNLVLKDRNDDGSLKCPCCSRKFTDQSRDVELLQKTVYGLMGENSPLIKADGASEDRRNAEKKQLLEWQKFVLDNMGGLLDYWRVSSEVDKLETESKELDLDITNQKESLKSLEAQRDDLESEVAELAAFGSKAERWSHDASRIAERKTQIGMKRVDLSINVPNSDRDLRTVERDVVELRNKKDLLTSKIDKNNKLIGELTEKHSVLSEQAVRADTRAREVRSKYDAQEKTERRKKELKDEELRLVSEEKRVFAELSPLERSIKLREKELQQRRDKATLEEKDAAEAVNLFSDDARVLNALTQQIEEYETSGGADNLAQTEGRLTDIDKEVKVKQQSLRKLQPKLDSIRSLVKEQERRKNQLIFNIEILEETDRVKNIEEEIEAKKKAVSQIDGYETAEDSYARALEKKSKLTEKRAQVVGRYGEIVERIRSVKRKLAAPEYKDVDRQYSVAMIKSETTQIAADDLKKYQKALDQALLQYHSVKIAEVNKRIRDLWLLTYKGEDITNIEIVSGQETGSRAAKSYNYRVVMSKGSSTLDMRGRCSAGQRVLACIVIRLALAETFGVNCGTIALDEPTVNLDYRNKKGLAVALAQIVSERSNQRNFQLILITHDEEFVGMMKTELSVMTGFSMPEQYFQVCREQAPDGKYYSKINAVDWNDI